MEFIRFELPESEQHVWSLSPREAADELEFLDLMRNVLESRTFYFARDYEITHSLQRAPLLLGHCLCARARVSLCNNVSVCGLVLLCVVVLPSIVFPVCLRVLLVADSASGAVFVWRLVLRCLTFFLCVCACLLQVLIL